MKKVKSKKKVDYTKLVWVHTNRRSYNLNIFRRLGDLFRSIYFGDILLKHAKYTQNEMEGLMRDLSVDNAKRADRVTSRRDTLKKCARIF